jgi:hypothetical protein
MKLPNNLSLSGNIGFIRKENGQVVKSLIINGNSLSLGEMTLKSAGQIKGKIIKMNKNPSGSGWVLVDQILPENGSLNGEQLIIANKGERDATYTIKSIKREGKYSKIECGPITFAIGLKNSVAQNSKDPYANYIYEFEEGDSFSIPAHNEWSSNK